jgi:glutathione transport system substrate-binding protein
MEFLQQQFAEVGVKLTVTPLESGVLSASISASTPQQATVQMFYIGWSSSTGDADWGLRVVFSKTAFPPQLLNTAYYYDPSVEKSLRAGLQTADPTLRGEAYAGAQAQIWKDCPMVWLSVDHILDARAQNLIGAYRLPDGGPLLEEARFT